MIKKEIGMELSKSFVVFSGFTLLVSNLAVDAKSQLPFCPAVSDQKAESIQMPKEELSPIRLETSKPETSSEKKNLKNENTSAKSTSLEKARNVNCVPLPLMLSQTEGTERRRIQMDAQQKQLEYLWSATIDRSPDIQYVVEAMQPKTDQKHAVADGMKLVGKTLFSVGTLAVPNGPAKPAVNLGAPMIAKLFSTNNTNGASQLSVGETMVLYKMVRDVADKLVNDYRNYRSSLAERDAAEMDLNELRRLAQGIAQEGSATQFTQFQYTLSKAQRDASLSEDRAEMNRQKLLDLVGAEVVEKLDADISLEREALEMLIGRTDIKAPLAAPTPSSAQSLESQQDHNESIRK